MDCSQGIGRNSNLGLELFFMQTRSERNVQGLTLMTTEMNRENEVKSWSWSKRIDALRKTSTLYQIPPGCQRSSSFVPSLTTGWPWTRKSLVRQFAVLEMEGKCNSSNSHHRYTFITVKKELLRLVKKSFRVELVHPHIIAVNKKI